jgi:hypothetical protein
MRFAVVVSALVGSSIAYETPPPPCTDSSIAYGSSSFAVPSRPATVSSSAYRSSTAPTSTYRSRLSSTPVASPTSSPVSSAIPSPANNWLNWRTFKANGANLGGWLEKERTHDPIWWDAIGGMDAPDGKLLSFSQVRKLYPGTDTLQNGPSASSSVAAAARYSKAATRPSSTPARSISSPPSA